MPIRVPPRAALLLLVAALGAGCHSAAGGVPSAPPGDHGGDVPGAPGQGADSGHEAGAGGASGQGGGDPGSSDPQGCGVDTPLRKYVGRSQDECARIRFACEPGFGYFSDDCGCGCQKQP